MPYLQLLFGTSEHMPLAIFWFWYVVTRGRKTRIFTSWEECHEHVNGFPGALFKKYKTKEEATAAFFGTADKEDVNLGDKGTKNHGTAEKEVASFKSKDVLLIVL